MTVLGGLIAATAWAVAAWASPWLVAPYLVLMAWLLAPLRIAPPRPPASPPSPLDEGVPVVPGSATRPAAASTPAVPAPTPAEGGAPVDPAGSPPDARPPIAPPRRKPRGKGTGRKAKPAAPRSPEPATWVQVGPGKFVRADPPVATPADLPPTGPEATDEPLGVVPAAPNLEPADNVVPPAVEPVATPSGIVPRHDERREEGTSPSPDAVGPLADPRVLPRFEWPPTDGATPIADHPDQGRFAFAVDGDGLGESVAAPTIVVDPSSSAAPEIAALEELIAPAEPEVSDPTETTADEADFDDAGCPAADEPILPMPASIALDVSPDDPVAVMDPPHLPGVRPIRLFQTGLARHSRGADRPRPVGRTSAPTRRGRSRAGWSRLATSRDRCRSRRESRTGHRSVRTFPPRSPPRRPGFWGR